MDLRRLAHIVALAEERHFGRAAEKVHLSQPAFSRSIQSAESEVGLLLFDRGPIEATPTAAGLLVLERARRLLFESRCLQRDVTLFREQKLGDMAFGVGPFPAATLLPGLLVALRTRLPAIRTRVMVNNWGVLVEQLRAEELDFFVADIRDVPRDGDLEVRLCGRQTGRLYVRRGHPLLQHQRLTAAQVAPYGLASVRLPVSVQAQMRLALGLEPQDRLPVALECDDIPLLKQVCLESDTVLACSDEALRAEVATGGLVPLDLPDLPTMQSEMGVVSLKGRTHAPVARFAVDFLASAVLPSGPQQPGP